MIISSDYKYVFKNIYVSKGLKVLGVKTFPFSLSFAYLYTCRRGNFKEVIPWSIITWSVAENKTNKLEGSKAGGCYVNRPLLSSFSFDEEKNNINTTNLQFD